MFQGITITDSTGEDSATILPEFGFNCISWQVTTLAQQPTTLAQQPTMLGKKVELLDTLPGFTEGTQRPSSSGIPILFPFPNRIREGEFTYQGQTYQLPKNSQQKNAIHGFVFDRPFRVINHSSNSITGCFQLSIDAPDRSSLWPADFELQVTYTILRHTLLTTFTIKNPASTSGPNLPWGLGTHAYFKLPLAESGNAAECTVHAAANDYWELNENLPTGCILPVTEQLDLRKGKKYADCKFDDILTNLPESSGKVISRIDNPAASSRIVQTSDGEFKQLVVFTPVGRQAICLEPYTCVSDSMNLSQQGVKETGWQELAPGAEKTLQIKLEFQQIIHD